MDNNELIRLEQPPIISESLIRLKDRFWKYAEDANSMICTNETIQSIKAFRAEMRKDYQQIEEIRKSLKKAVMQPYEQFEQVYKDCVTVAFSKADKVCADKISAVESEIKRQCEESLREYFDELCAAHHVEWLKYEQARIKIDIASAKQKTPKKLREQLVCFVVRVSSDVDTISMMEHPDEILTEYKQCLSLSQAVCTVVDRHRRIEAEREALDTRSTARAAEIEAERRIEALGPPAIVKPPEKDPDEVVENVPFKIIKATRRQIWRLKEFMGREGIQYE